MRQTAILVGRHLVVKRLKVNGGYRIIAAMTCTQTNFLTDYIFTLYYISNIIFIFRVMISGRKYWKMSKGIPTRITMECRMSMTSLRLVHLLPLQHVHIQDGSRLESTRATEHVSGILWHDSETRDVAIPFSIHRVLCKTHDYMTHNQASSKQNPWLFSELFFQTKKLTHNLSWETGEKIHVTFLILRFRSFSANCVLSIVFSRIHTCAPVLNCNVQWHMIFWSLFGHPKWRRFSSPNVWLENIRKHQCSEFNHLVSPSCTWHRAHRYHASPSHCHPPLSHQQSPHPFWLFQPQDHQRHHRPPSLLQFSWRWQFGSKTFGIFKDILEHKVIITNITNITSQSSRLSFLLDLSIR